MLKIMKHTPIIMIKLAHDLSAGYIAVASPKAGDHTPKKGPRPNLPNFNPIIHLEPEDMVKITNIVKNYINKILPGISYQLYRTRFNFELFNCIIEIQISPNSTQQIDLTNDSIHEIINIIDKRCKIALVARIAEYQNTLDDHAIIHAKWIKDIENQ